jgi:multiple sugar transport system permease protein
MRSQRHDLLVGLGFMLPALLLTFTIFAYPLYKAIDHSLHRLLLNRPQRTAFIGLDNYWRLLFDDPAFRDSILVTAIFVTATVLMVVAIGLAIAGLLARGRATRTRTPLADRFQIAFLLPVLMTPAVSGTIFRVFIWDYDTGLANWLSMSLGGPRVAWLVEPRMALFAVIMTEVWAHVPLAVLVLYSAMKGAPVSLYEAAMIDGAGNWRQFLHITLPYVRPQIVFVAILQTTLSFRQFELIFLTTGGGPASATRVLTIHIFQEAMARFNFGYANAMGVTSLLLVGAVCGTIIGLFGRTHQASFDK